MLLQAALLSLPLTTVIPRALVHPHSMSPGALTPLEGPAQQVPPFLLSSCPTCQCHRSFILPIYTFICYLLVTCKCPPLSSLPPRSSHHHLLLDVHRSLKPNISEGELAPCWSGSPPGLTLSQGFALSLPLRPNPASGQLYLPTTSSHCQVTLLPEVLLQLAPFHSLVVGKEGGRETEICSQFLVQMP